MATICYALGIAYYSIALAVLLVEVYEKRKAKSG